MTNLTVTEVSWPSGSPASGRSAAGPYGIEALCRENSGNWVVLVEPREYTPEDFRREDFE